MRLNHSYLITQHMRKGWRAMRKSYRVRGVKGCQRKGTKRSKSQRIQTDRKGQKDKRYWEKPREIQTDVYRQTIKYRATQLVLSYKLMLSHAIFGLEFLFRRGEYFAFLLLYTALWPGHTPLNIRNIATGTWDPRGGEEICGTNRQTETECSSCCQTDSYH